MEGQKNIHLRNSIILTIFYAVGFFLNLSNDLNFVLKYLNPIFLFSVFIIIVLEERLEIKFILWLIVSYFFTFSMEVIGVKTTLIFGNYYYGQNLGTKLFDVPLVIGLNWITLMLGSIGFVSLLEVKFPLKVIFVGIIMCIFDFVLEIIAPKLNYWFWIGGVVPLKNFFSWFFISLLMSTVYFSLRIDRQLGLAKVNLILQFFFFLFLLLFKN